MGSASEPRRRDDQQGDEPDEYDFSLVHLQHDGWAIMASMETTSENNGRWGRGDCLRTLSRSVVIGLGGNQGDVRASFRDALRALAQRSSCGRVSSLYRSAPIGPAQPDFLNAAVLLEWPGTLHELLTFTQSLEQAAGRERIVRWGPRTLDLDILWAGERELCTSSLTVPHPRLRERRFALEPLLELFPDDVEPIPGVSLRETLLTLEGQPLKRLVEPPW